jgi:P2-related tail formation protein
MLDLNAKNLLPPNATNFEIDVVSVIANRVNTIYADIRLLTDSKLKRTHKSLLPWVIQEFGFGSVSKYIPDNDEFMSEGIAWKRDKGTPSSIKRAFSWLFRNDILEENTQAWHWTVVEVRLTTDIDSLDVVKDIVYLVRQSLPARAVLSRVWSGEDFPMLVLNQTNLNQSRLNVPGGDWNEDLQLWLFINNKIDFIVPNLRSTVEVFESIEDYNYVKQTAYLNEDDYLNYVPGPIMTVTTPLPGFNTVIVPTSSPYWSSLISLNDEQNLADIDEHVLVLDTTISDIPPPPEDVFTSTAVVAAHFNSPFISAYPWDDATGFGTKYSDPSILVASFSVEASFNPTNKAIAVAHNNSPFISTYSWDDSTGFGAKYSNPSVLPGSTGRAVAFNPTNTTIGVGHDDSPFISAYPWDDTTGFGTKYSDPSTLPTGTGRSVAFNPTNNVVSVAYINSPFISAYQWNDSTGFGVKYTDPSILPPSFSVGVAFNPTNKAIAVGHSNSPVISTYSWDDATGFGSKYANPSVLPGNFSTVLSVAFNPTNNVVSGAHVNFPRIFAYAWNDDTGFGTKYSDPGTTPTGDGRGISFNLTNTAVVAAHLNSPFITAYPWDDTTGFGTKYSDPSILVAGSGSSVAFNKAKV